MLNNGILTGNTNLPEKQQMEGFCIPTDCPERAQTLQLPSPTSCLPQEILEELELRIRAANEFLLNSSLSSEREILEVIEGAMEGLIGQEVELEIDCSLRMDETGEINTVIGRVQLAGRDFTVLTSGRKQLLVPNQKICKIQLKNRFAEPVETEGLLEDIDPCLRRCITLRFGEVVSGSVELIQIFYGLTQEVYLLQFIDQEIEIITPDEKLKAKLHDVRDKYLILCDEKKNRIMPMEEPCIITLPICKG
ncbi:hypothetical protein [Gracilibacillus xinjiangensis]|uniref:DUF3794 domain-containing protein n=1 Tax=Gracilibacillus xinjiangensis TaxID=1193282 RepID=A0ABV8WYC6_9BACI